MLHRFISHITTELPQLITAKIGVAISGGVDSIVLTDLLVNVNTNIVLLHCNFQLRGEESDADANFVSEIAQTNWKVPCFVKVFETLTYAENEKKSVQVAARDLRYGWFKEMAEKQDLKYILTAHHADDSLETLLINLSRGTGLKGLLGIPKENGIFCRPLLHFTRKEILKYAHQNQLKWREDSSNSSEKYQRNKIRKSVIPVLKEAYPSLEVTLQQTLHRLYQSNQVVIDFVLATYNKIVVKHPYFTDVYLVNIGKLQQTPNYALFIFEWLHPYGFTQWQDIENLLSSQSGKQVASKKYILLKDREELWLFPNSYLNTQKKQILTPLNNENIHLDSGINCEIDWRYEVTADEKPIVASRLDKHFNKTTDNRLKKQMKLLLDPKMLPDQKLELHLRKWEHADVFYPTGMYGKKKVSNYFKDQKLSLLEKQQKWLLCTSNNQIIAIMGMRGDRRFLNYETSSKYSIKISWNENV